MFGSRLLRSAMRSISATVDSYIGLFHSISDIADSALRTTPLASEGDKSGEVERQRAWSALRRRLHDAVAERRVRHLEDGHREGARNQEQGEEGEDPALGEIAADLGE